VLIDGADYCRLIGKIPLRDLGMVLATVHGAVAANACVHRYRRKNLEHVPQDSSRDLNSVAAGIRAARSEWLQLRREPAIAAVKKAALGARWSARLLRVLLEELHVDHEVAQVMGDLPLTPARSAQAVVVALAIRHSWRVDDFRRLLRRLEPKRSRLATMPAKRRPRADSRRSAIS
jgi:hypothetical protein